MRVNVHRPEASIVRRAAETIRRGGVVAAPTDTLYGLLADARRPAAVREVFRIKRRPAHKPVLLLMDSLGRVRRVAHELPDALDAVAAAFWPGPLTVVLPARPDVPRSVTAGLSTVAVRVPRSPLVRALVRQAACPLTGTSANLSGRSGATTAREVFAQLGGRVTMLLDAGRVARPVPSTIVDLSSGTPCLLREGCIGQDAIDRVLLRAGLAQLAGRR